MKQIVIEGFAYCKPEERWNEGQINVIDGFAYDYCHTELNGCGFINVGKAKLIIEAPEDFDPRLGVVDALKEQKKAIMAEFQNRINQIDEQISKYTAIGCEVQA